MGRTCEFARDESLVRFRKGWGGGELITEGSTKDLDPSAVQFRPIVALSPSEIVPADENAPRANAESISFYELRHLVLFFNPLYGMRTRVQVRCFRL